MAVAGRRRSTTAAVRSQPAATLRTARRTDLEAMYRLDRRCFEPGIAFTRAELGRFFDLETLQAVSAHAGARLVGFAIGYLRHPTVAGVLTLDVDPAVRRQGVGRRLFRDLLERLESAGASSVRLEVDVRNAGALAFYRSFGFRRLGRIADYYGEGRDAFEMERSGAIGGVAAGTTRRPGGTEP